MSVVKISNLNKSKISGKTTACITSDIQGQNILTDLINALPGNSSVNTVTHTTIEEVVFSVSAVSTRGSGW
jgi:hypothetical protein